VCAAVGHRPRFAKCRWLQCGVENGWLAQGSSRRSKSRCCRKIIPNKNYIATAVTALQSNLDLFCRTRTICFRCSSFLFSRIQSPKAHEEILHRQQTMRSTGPPISFSRVATCHGLNARSVATVVLIISRKNKSSIDNRRNPRQELVSISARHGKRDHQQRKCHFVAVQEASTRNINTHDNRTNGVERFVSKICRPKASA
jgi:hypothetical protein